MGNQQTKKEPYLKRQATVMILECYSIYIILITRTWETGGYISSGLALWTGVILKWPMWNKNGFWDKPVGQTVVQTKRFLSKEVSLWRAIQHRFNPQEEQWFRKN